MPQEPGNDAFMPFVAGRGGRERLLTVFASLGYKTGVEIGVRTGDFSLLMCTTIPGLKLFCVDPWVAYDYLDQRRQNGYYRKARRKLAPHGARLIREKSSVAVNRFEDASLDFVYIDGDHNFDAVMLDIILWTPKIRAGGVIAGHDYFFCPPTARAVDAYAANHALVHPWYVFREARGGSWAWVVKR